MKTKIMIAITLLIGAITATAQDGQISKRDIFGNRTIRYNNGVTATLSRPDIFGNQNLRYNTGANIQISKPDIFGNQQIRVITPDR